MNSLFVPLLSALLLLVVLLQVAAVGGRPILHREDTDSYTVKLRLGGLPDGNHTVKLFASAVLNPLTAEERPSDDALDAAAPLVRFVVEDQVITSLTVIGVTGHLPPLRLRVSTDVRLLGEDDHEDDDDEEEGGDGGVGSDESDAAAIARELSRARRQRAESDFFTKSPGELSREPSSEELALQELERVGGSGGSSASATPSLLVDFRSDHTLDVKEVSVAARIPLSEFRMVDVAMRCDLFARRMTSFKFTARLRDLPDDELVEVVPRNSSFATRFVVRKNAAAGTLGVWVRRRPPIPPLLLRVLNVIPRQLELRQGDRVGATTGGAVTNSLRDARDFAADPTTNEVVEPPERLTFIELLVVPVVAVHPRGMGVSDCMSRWRQEASEIRERGARLAVGARVVDTLDDVAVRLQVEFEEFPREHHLFFVVDNLESLVAKLLLHDGASVTLDPQESPGADSNEAAGAAKASRPPGSVDDILDARDVRIEEALMAEVGLAARTDIDAADVMHADDEVIHRLRVRRARRQRVPLRLRLQYFAHTGHIAAMLVQQRPLRQVQLHAVDALNRTVFLEEEDDVPFIRADHIDGPADPAAAPASRTGPPADRSLHFGWYHFFEPTGEQMREVAGNRLTIHVLFSSAPPDVDADGRSTQAAAVEQAAVARIRDWLRVHGAVGADHIAVSRSRAGAWRLELAAAGGEVWSAGEVVAALPWTTVVTVDKVQMAMRAALEELSVSAALREFEAKWAPVSIEEAAEESGASGPGLLRRFGWRVTQFEMRLLKLTAFFLAQADDALEGTRFFRLRESLLVRPSPHGFVNGNLVFPPMFAEDLRLLLPPPLHIIADLALTLDELIRDEYVLLNNSWPWFGGRVPAEDFYAMRLAVGARAVLDSRDSPVIVPLLERAVHSDEPSAALRVNDAAETIEVVALRKLRHGSPLALDRGAERHTLLSFWMSFGTVSHSAVDVVDVAGVLLTAHSKASRDPLLRRVCGGSMACVIDKVVKRRAELPRNLGHRTGLDAQARLRFPAARSLLLTYSNDVLEGMRRALHAHHTWATDDLRQHRRTAGDEL